MVPGDDDSDPEFSPPDVTSSQTPMRKQRRVPGPNPFLEKLDPDQKSEESENFENEEQNEENGRGPENEAVYEEFEDEFDWSL